ncbi:MAG: hypothetical protein R3Y19_03935 [Rikenellaceae bacterium]
MKRFLLLVALATTYTFVANAQSTTQDSLSAKKSESKIQVKFGGRLDVVGTYDSYGTISQRNVEFIAPAAAQYNSYGEDISATPSTAFSFAPSRLNMTVTTNDFLGASIKSFIEIDFMGTGDAPINVPRLRHGYVSLDWGKRKLLIGQTSAIAGLEISTNALTYGSGSPYLITSRPVQLIFTQKVSEYSYFDFAVAVNGSGQMQGLIPDFHARYMFGDPSKFSAGISGGITPVKPRYLTDDERLSSQYVVGWDVSAFAKYKTGGHTLTFYGIMGANLSHLHLLGGYAPLASDVDAGVDDYGYASTKVISLLFDYETKRCKNWGAGLLLGYQANLGSTGAIDVSQLDQHLANNLDSFWAIQPRITYLVNNRLLFGLEYSYSQSSWAESMDSNYKAVGELTKTHNNRAVFLTRFTF